MDPSYQLLHEWKNLNQVVRGMMERFKRNYCKLGKLYFIESVNRNNGFSPFNRFTIEYI